MPRRIEAHMIAGPAGRLEALLEEPEEAEPAFVALVAHPHPQHGGTMHNKVVHRTARALRTAGAAVLRFNYRGVNLSEGEYGRGVGEAQDARVCLDWLRVQYPRLPAMIAGFSFGSRIALRIATERPELFLAVAAGYPTRYTDHSFLDPCAVPRVFVQSTADEHGPRPDLEALVAGLSPRPALLFIEAQDHFFAGALDEFEAQVLAAVRTARH